MFLKEKQRKNCVFLEENITGEEKGDKKWFFGRKNNNNKQEKEHENEERKRKQECHYENW